MWVSPVFRRRTPSGSVMDGTIQSREGGAGGWRLHLPAHMLKSLIRHSCISTPSWIQIRFNKAEKRGQMFSEVSHELLDSTIRIQDGYIPWGRRMWEEEDGVRRKVESWWGRGQEEGGVTPPSLEIELEVRYVPDPLRGHRQLHWTTSAVSCQFVCTYPYPSSIDSPWNECTKVTQKHRAGFYPTLL